MSAFLMKCNRIAVFLVGAISVCFTIFAFFYAGILANVQTMQAERSFYFLVSNSAHVEVSAHTVRFQGGAGYFLDCDKGEYAAYAVYFSIGESQTALQSLKSVEENAEIIELKANPLYRKRGNAPSEEVKGAFNCLYAYMQILQNEISRLEKGATQESSRRILGRLARQFSYLGEHNAKSVSGLENVCGYAQACLSEWIKDVIYVKDLRYLLCELSVAYVDLSENFLL